MYSRKIYHRLRFPFIAGMNPVRCIGDLLLLCEMRVLRGMSFQSYGEIGSVVWLAYFSK